MNIIEKIIKNSCAICGQCGRAYKNANDMYNSKFGCPRNCKKPKVYSRVKSVFDD